MSRRPLISVLTPAFNAAATLDDAVSSVVRQSLAAWELVVGDDGSTDGTRDIVEDWVRRDPRIRLVEHPDRANRGRPATRNLTVAAASADVVAFLDADDWLLEGALETHAEVLARTPEAAVSYGLGRVSGGARDGRIVGRGVPGCAADVLEQLARFNVLVTSATAVRRTALGPAPFAESMPLCQDWACWLELARRERFVHIASPLAAYRVHPGAGTATMLRERGEAAYEDLQAAYLRQALASGTPRERRILRSGLSFRACTCLLRGLAAGRRGRPREALGWFGAARTVAGSAGNLARAALAVPGEQRRIWRGEDPPLRVAVPEAPDNPPEGPIEPGRRRQDEVGE